MSVVAANNRPISRKHSNLPIILSMTEEMKRNMMFNPKGDDTVEVRTIIKGTTTGLFNLNATK